MEVGDLVIHEWAPDVTIVPIYGKDATIRSYLIGFEFQDPLQAEKVLEAVAKAANHE